MGQEISVSHFKHYDFRRFEELIDCEMRLLHEWFRDSRFSTRRGIGGLELEMWIVDERGQPLAINEELLAQGDSDDVVPELSRFNIEFNVEPQSLEGHGLALMESDLRDKWESWQKRAAEMGAALLTIGTLPTLRNEHLSLKTMSRSLRYHALNEQFLRLRQGKPVCLEIEGDDRIRSERSDVMLEAGSTSVQFHLQVGLAESVRFYNASLISSAPLTAVAANSPTLFGRVLWHETRIPLCEQALDVGVGRLTRVSFGSGYAERKLEECFVENREQYAIMLPLTMDEPSEQVAHIRLHNGTIWRWNRPIIGFDDTGQPHLRIEQRVPAAGPTIGDMMADMAFYFGLVEALATSAIAPETQIPFTTARANFYLAARHGLDAELIWLDRKQISVRELLLKQLLPLARRGLEQLGVERDLADRLLAVIEGRALTRQNGASWQRRFLERHGREMEVLTREYTDRQRAGAPVHQWDV